MPRANERYPRGGRRDPKCPVCGRHFLPDDPRAIYCSQRCKSSAAFKRWYEKPGNAEKIIKYVQGRRALAKKLAREG